MHTVLFETRSHKIETETKYIDYLARRHAYKSQIMNNYIILTNPIDQICVVLICFDRKLYENCFFSIVPALSVQTLLNNNHSTLSKFRGLKVKDHRNKTNFVFTSQILKIST